MDSGLQHLKDLQWIVTRIDGKIAAVSTDWHLFGRISSKISCWQASRVSEISCSKISTDELFRISDGMSWEDLYLIGTAFQKKVWEALFRLTHRPVPYRNAECPPVRLLSYTDFAVLCGNLPGVRAVAHAVGQNPVPVIIPCHLIVPKDVTDRIARIEKEAESSLFGKDGLCFDRSFDFGEFSCPGGKTLKRELIAFQFSDSGRFHVTRNRQP